jgi:outer membrane lipoprotein SlyB
MTMTKFFSTFTAAALALSVIAPMASTSVHAASYAKIEKQCHKYANKKAHKKTNQRVVSNVIVGGVVGGLLGSAIGGKKTTVGMAAGGAALGMVDGASSYDHYYAIYFERCMDEALD